MNLLIQKPKPMLLKRLLSAITFSCCFVFVQAQESGIASYYHPGFDGEKTSSGQTYRHKKKTAASRDFPIGTILRVIRADDGRSTEVRVNDCGPRRQDRIIDLSGAAAEEIGLIEDGITQIRLEVVRRGRGRMPCGASYSVASKPVDNVPQSYDASGTAPPEAQQTPERPKGPAIDGQGTFRAEALQPIEAGFGVQVGAYRDYVNAEREVQKFQNKGYSKVLIRLQGNMHQVVLGPFPTRDQANTYRQNLWTNYKVKGFVTAIE